MCDRCHRWWTQVLACEEGIKTDSRGDRERRDGAVVEETHDEVGKVETSLPSSNGLGESRLDFSRLEIQ